MAVIAVHIKPLHSCLLNISHSTVLMAKQTNAHRTHIHTLNHYSCVSLNRKEDILLSPFTGLNLFSFLEKKSRLTVQKQNVLKNASVTVRMHQYKERIEMKLEKMRLQ